MLNSLLLSAYVPTLADDRLHDWQPHSPREELRPHFSTDAAGGPKQTGSLIITHDQRDGLDGWYQKSFNVVGGQCYRFSTIRKVSEVSSPRRSALVRIVWKDEAGRMVSAHVPEQQIKDFGHTPTAEPEHPRDTGTDANGWTTVGGFYRAPDQAKRAIVELHLQWAPNGRIEWSEMEFERISSIPKRTVRLATIHYRPTGKSPLQNCQEYEPMLAEAAQRQCDLVVLGETVPAVGVQLKAHETAESIPGPSTIYFGEQAKKHRLHIAVSLYERDQHLVYNTAILLGPQGELIGKYRKVCLPHNEVESGIAPGNAYPVFETRFGKVGMMVCYDGFFPEVARELTNGGAEVIAWPVWGCNPLLARARACENHVYVVSSTYSQPSDGWMLSAIYDQSGTAIAQADSWGKVVVAEVDLNQPYIGPYNLGDFGSMVPRHRP
jgi:predicted amidohydrolase